MNVYRTLSCVLHVKFSTSVILPLSVRPWLMPSSLKYMFYVTFTCPVSEAATTSQLAESLPSTHKALGSMPSREKTRCGAAHPYQYRGGRGWGREVFISSQGAQGQPGLSTRPCLKNENASCLLFAFHLSPSNIYLKAKWPSGTAFASYF